MHTKNIKAKIFPPKLKSAYLLTHPSEYASIKNNDCDLLHHAEISSSHKTTGSHTCSCEYSAKDNPSMNFQKYGGMKQEIFIANSEIVKGEASSPPPPPQTTEMMYTAVQKRPKDSILAEVDDAPPVPPYMEKEDKETEATAKGSDEGSPPPVPPQTTEMLCIAV